MKDKILSAMIEGIGKTNINEITLNAYADLIADKITDESQIAEAIKPHVAFFKTHVQGNINSTIKDAVSAKESELNKKIEDLTKLAPDPQKQEPNKDVPEWQEAINTLTKNVETLTGSLTAIQGEKLQITLSQKLSDSIKAKGIPDYYANPAIAGRVFKDESEVIAFADNLGVQWGEAKQVLANNGFKETVPPSSGSGDVKDTALIASAISTGTKQIVEQQKQN